MKFDCYLSLSCGAEDDLRQNIARALSLEGAHAEVNFYRINEEEAGRLGLSGSPSVRVNGKDIEPAEGKGFS